MFRTVNFRMKYNTSCPPNMNTNNFHLLVSCTPQFLESLVLLTVLRGDAVSENGAYSLKWFEIYNINSNKGGMVESH